MASLETLQKHGISDHLVCFLHSFFFQNTRVRAHASRTIFTWCPDWRNAAEGAGDGLAVGAGCPISEIYFGSDAALKHVFKGIQAWLHGDSFQQAGNMFGVEYYLQTISQMFHAHQNTLHDKKVSITNRPNFWTESLASRSFSHHGTIHTSEFDNMNCVECRQPLRQGVGFPKILIGTFGFPCAYDPTGMEWPLCTLWWTMRN